MVLGFKDPRGRTYPVAEDSLPVTGGYPTAGCPEEFNKYTAHGGQTRSFSHVRDHLNTLMEKSWYHLADNAPVSIVAEDASAPQARHYMLPDLLAMRTRWQRLVGDDMGYEMPSDEWFITYRRNMRKAWLTPWRMFRADPHSLNEEFNNQTFMDKIFVRPWMDSSSHRWLVGGLLKHGSFQDQVAHAYMIGAATEQPREVRHTIREVASKEMFKCMRNEKQQQYASDAWWTRPSYEYKSKNNVECLHKTWAAILEKGLVADPDIEIPFVFKGKYSEFNKKRKDLEQEFQNLNGITQASNNAMTRRWTNSEIEQFGGAGIFDAVADDLNKEVIPRQDQYMLNSGHCDYVNLGCNFLAPQIGLTWFFGLVANVKNELFHNLKDTKMFGFTPATGAAQSQATFRPIPYYSRGLQMEEETHGFWAHRRTTAARRERGTFLKALEVPQEAQVGGI